MKTVGARELKNHLGAYLRQVREGMTIIVTDRGTPIAELSPLAPLAGSEAAALASLTADGLVSPPTRSRLTADATLRLRTPGHCRSDSRDCSDGRTHRQQRKYRCQ